MASESRTDPSLGDSNAPPGLTGRRPRPLALEAMRGFYLLLSSQFVSIFASRMRSFAITHWAWDLTGQATSLVLGGLGHDR